MILRYLLVLVSLATWMPSLPAVAQLVAPSKGGEVNIIKATATTMTLRFGTSGTGQGRIVAMAVAPDGRPVPLAATDGQFYNAAATYGSGSVMGNGYVVYNGSDHAATISGLQPGTSYYITNAEYNTDNTNIAYNISGTSISMSTSNAPPAPLPVELTAFTGTVDVHNLATLRWATASERNTAYFALERSTDGTTFSETSRVAAHGTSYQTLAYQWTDPQQLARSTYYRLRQVDLDGDMHYSSVVTLAPTSTLPRQVEVYPNPSTGQNIQLALQGYGGEALTIRLTDALGHTLLTRPLTAIDTQYLAPLTLPQILAPGTYILTLTGSSSAVQKRIVVSN